VTGRQYLPELTEADIGRVVGRDYAPQLQPVVEELIQAVEVIEKTRVVIACLKNANGDFEKLKGELANASGWWREIISEAEYPNYTKKMFRIERLSADERQRIIDKDKKQYLDWLQR
jgi:hypothetical protein